MTKKWLSTCAGSPPGPSVNYCKQEVIACDTPTSRCITSAPVAELGGCGGAPAPLVLYNPWNPLQILTMNQKDDDENEEEEKKKREKEEDKENEPP